MVLFFPNETISLPLPTVDKKVRGLKSFFFAVVTWLDTEDLPNGSATSVNYGSKDNFKLICNAHNSLHAFPEVTVSNSVYPQNPGRWRSMSAIVDVSPITAASRTSPSRQVRSQR